MKMVHSLDQDWRELVESYPDPVVVTVHDRLVFANAAAVSLLGAAMPEQLIGRSLIDFASADQYDVLQQFLTDEQDGPEIRPLRHEITRLDGDWRIVESLTKQITYQGTPAVLVVLRDVTERRRQEEQFRTFARTISAGICGISLSKPLSADASAELQAEHILEHGRVYESNQQMASILGAQSAAALRGRALGELLSDKAVARSFVEYRYRLENYELQVPVPTKGRRHLVVNATGTVEKGRLENIWASCIDVTERVEMERRTVTLLEKQQQDIGRELHDGVGQTLTGMTMLANLLRDRLTDDELGRDLATKVTQFAEEASSHIRSIYHGLTPVQIQREGLASLLDELVSRTVKLPGVHCRFEHEAGTDVYSDETKLHMYRIAQEAMHNAVKHAKAKRIVVSLKREGDNVCLRIKDNGIGYQPKRRSKKSLGIDSMYYRARVIYADIDICGAPGAGTTVECRLPSALEVESNVA